MKRILADVLPDVGEVFQPSPEECHHLLKVRRIRVGEVVEVLDGEGGLARGEVRTVGRRQLEIAIMAHASETRESSLTMALAVAIPVQLSTFDAVLPGLVQLGVKRIVLVQTAYSGQIRKDVARYLARLTSIADQSLKQCGRTRRPEILLAGDFEELCAGFAEENALNIVFHPGPTEPMPERPAGPLGLLIGPEGGFTEPEVTHAREAGFLRRGLGPRILKMETALVGACFWAQDRFGDLT